MSKGDATSVLETKGTGTTEMRPKSATPRSWRRGFWSLVVTQFQGSIESYSPAEPKLRSGTTALKYRASAN